MARLAKPAYRFFFDISPSRPAGWRAWYSSRVKPRADLERRPRASRAPAARRRCSRAARGRARRPRARRPRRARRPTRFASGECGVAGDRDHAARRARARAATAASSSCVAPLLLIAITTSPGTICPALPCTASVRVQERGRRAGRREQRRGVAREVLGLADARHVHATAARLGVADQRERGADTLSVSSALAQRGAAPRPRRRARRASRRPSGRGGVARGAKRRAVVELERARGAPTRRSAGKGAERSTHAAPPALPSRAASSQPRPWCRPASSAAEEGVARAGRVDRASRGGAATAPSKLVRRDRAARARRRSRRPRGCRSAGAARCASASASCRRRAAAARARARFEGFSRSRRAQHGVERLLVAERSARRRTAARRDRRSSAMPGRARDARAPRAPRRAGAGAPRS